jgi:predicted dehydrogenase
MMRAGSLGRLFASHGSYLQDWMLLETDYNWRVDAALGGASRAVADIGSHWCDTVQFVTGRRITEVMADLSIVWPTRRASKAESNLLPRRAGVCRQTGHDRRLRLGAVPL